MAWVYSSQVWTKRLRIRILGKEFAGIKGELVNGFIARRKNKNIEVKYE
jgi:hypothetical protein